MGHRGTWVLDPITQVELWAPEGCDPGSAIRRAQLQRDGALISVRLLPEHGVSWPIWQREVGLLDENSLPLSPALNAALREWSLFWATHLSMDGEWSSADNRDWWFRRARELEDALEIELWEVAVIERGFPVDDEGGGGA
ncbi:hypothetical protein [Leifsonia sp. EB34]|uniref:hypothetical protein n=1 Tax=Leifsonia sp. EB34 TaxID=3156303 RepID=UPI003512C4A9